MMGESISGYKDYKDKAAADSYIYRKKPEVVLCNEEMQRLYQPFGEIEYKESGDVHFQKEPFELKFSYKEADKKTSEFIERGRDLGLKEVTKLVFQKEGVDKPIQLSDIMSEEYKLIISTVGFESRNSLDGFFNSYHKIVALGTNINSPLGILVFLHEIGHLQDREKLNEDEKKLFDEADYNKFGSTNNAVVLKRERNANAFMLGKMKPFLDDEDVKGNFSILRDDVRKVTKHITCRYDSQIKAVQMNYNNYIYDDLGDPFDDYWEQVEEERYTDY